MADNDFASLGLAAVRGRSILLFGPGGAVITTGDLLLAAPMKSRWARFGGFLVYFDCRRRIGGRRDFCRPKQVGFSRS